MLQPLILAAVIYSLPISVVAYERTVLANQAHIEITTATAIFCIPFPRTLITAIAVMSDGKEIKTSQINVIILSIFSPAQTLNVPIISPRIPSISNIGILIPIAYLAPYIRRES